MSAYKQFTTKDIVITPFSANKGFSFKGNAMTASNVGIEVYFGTQPPADKLIFPTSQQSVWNTAQGSSFSGSQNATGFVNKLNTNSVYSSAMQLYYSNYFGSMSGSSVPTASLLYGLRGPRNNPFATENSINIGLSGSNNLPIGAVKSPQYYNYEASTIEQTRTVLLGENLTQVGQLNNNYCSVISIPSKLYGNNIEPQSFRIHYQYFGGGFGANDGFYIHDDGNGNLLNTYVLAGATVIDNKYCGNICYEHGLSVLTPVTASDFTDSNLQLLLVAVGAEILYGQDGYTNGTGQQNNLFSNFRVGFSSSVTLYEHQYKCVVRENEFGYSLNPSLLSGSQTTQPLPGTNYVYKDFATGSYFSPYITTVGLYDNDKNLLAIGKLSQPTKVPINSDLEIQVSFDSV